MNDIENMEPSFALELKEPDRFYQLQGVYQTDPVRTFSSSDEVRANVTKGIFFFSHNDRLIIIRFNRSDVETALQLLRTRPLDELLFGRVQIDDRLQSLDYETDSFYSVQTRYFTVKKSAKYAGVSPKTIKSWFAKGLPYHKINDRLTLVDKEDIDEFIKRFRSVKSSTKTMEEKAQQLVQSLTA